MLGQQRAWQVQLVPLLVVVGIVRRHVNGLQQEGATDWRALRDFWRGGPEDGRHVVAAAAQAHEGVDVACGVHAEDLDSQEGGGGAWGDTHGERVGCEGRVEGGVGGDPRGPRRPQVRVVGGGIWGGLEEDVGVDVSGGRGCGVVAEGMNDVRIGLRWGGKLGSCAIDRPCTGENGGEEANCRRREGVGCGGGARGRVEGGSGVPVAKATMIRLRRRPEVALENDSSAPLYLKVAVGVGHAVRHGRCGVLLVDVQATHV